MIPAALARKVSSAQIGGREKKVRVKGSEPAARLHPFHLNPMQFLGSTGGKAIQKPPKNH